MNDILRIINQGFIANNLFCRFFSNEEQPLPPPGSDLFITENELDYFLTENDLDNFITE